MSIKLNYGRRSLTLDLAMLRDPAIVAGHPADAVADPRSAVLEAMSQPAGCMSLADEVRYRRARKAVIIVNDITRPTPYDIMLPPILDELAVAGICDENICFLIATGIHRAMAPDEIAAMLGQELTCRFRAINHDCDDSANLIYLGTLSHGTDFCVNRAALEADIVVGTGIITPHYFAGFSGGRKSILPGVAARRSISHNHSLMTSEHATACSVSANPVSQEMMEAARMAGLDFILNVVVDAEGRVCAAVAGDTEEAWLNGVSICQECSAVGIDRVYDVAVAGAGGTPKDINVYQAQKALENAQRAVRPGGTVILVAECTEGYGESRFEEWMKGSASPEDVLRRFAQGFELGGHKAYSLARVVLQKDVILISTLPDHVVGSLFMTPAHSMEEAVALVKQKHGEHFTAIVFPNASAMVPVLK